MAQSLFSSTPSSSTPSRSPSPSAFAGSSSSQPKPDKRKRSHFTPSIVTAEPQGDLFPVLPFGLNFKRLVEEQEKHDPYYEYFDDRDQEEEVANRCDTWKHQVETNKFFEDPTVFELLKGWHDQRLEPYQEVQDPKLRPTWASVYGQAEDDIDHGNIADIYARDHPKPGMFADDGLRSLLSSPARGRRKVAFRGRSQRTKRSHAETLDEGAEKGEEVRMQTGSNKRKPLVVDSDADAIEGESADAATERSKTIPRLADEGDSSSSRRHEHEEEERSPAGTDNNPQDPTLNPEESSTTADLSTTSSSDPKIHADIQGQDNGIPIMSLEQRFHEYSMMIEDSPLKTLADESRVELPIVHRVPLSYPDPKPPRYSIPYKPVVDQETIVSVALYRAQQPNQRMQEYLFLGSQPLTVMRDTFHCTSDFPPNGEEDATSDESPFRNTKNRKTSNSCMFIEGVFYIDTPLLRAKFDKKEELREKEHKRLERLVERCKQRYQDALSRRKKARRRKRKQAMTRTKRKRKPVEESESEGEDDNDNEDGQGSDLDYDDSDLRAQMAKSTFMDPPVEEIKVENEEALAAVSRDYTK